MRVSFVEEDDGRSTTATPGDDPHVSRTFSQRELGNDSGAIMCAIDPERFRDDVDRAIDQDAEPRA